MQGDKQPNLEASAGHIVGVGCRGRYVAGEVMIVD